MDRTDLGIIHKTTQRKIERKKPEEEEPKLSRHTKKKKGGGREREPTTRYKRQGGCHRQIHFLNMPRMQRGPTCEAVAIHSYHGAFLD